MRKVCGLFGNGANEVFQILQEYEKVLKGQVPINETAVFLAKNIDAQKIYALFESALEKAESSLVRNNTRLMRMAFRYTMLLQEDTQTAKTELGVMASYFDSFHNKDSAFGIAIVTDQRAEELPEDTWYKFEM